MQIVLSILQFLGCALLFVLILLVLIVLAVLFCSAKYLLDVHWTDEKKARFHFHWLFRIVRAKISYADDLIYGEFHYFGKRKTFSYDLTETKEKEETVSSEEENEKKEDSQEGIISKIKGMIERIKAAYPKLKKIIEDEKNKDAVTHLKNELIYLIKILMPKKSKVNAAFSTGSPDTTGQLFGILACFPAMYQKNWKVLPDFESDDMYFKGTIWGVGRFYGFQIIGIILRIVFDKNCRRLYTIIKRFERWLKKSDQAEVKING